MDNVLYKYSINKSPVQKRILLNKDIIRLCGLGRKKKSNGIFITYSKRYKAFCLCARNMNNIICFPEYLDQVQAIYKATTGMDLNLKKYNNFRKRKYPEVEFFLNKPEDKFSYKEPDKSKHIVDKIEKEIEKESWWTKILKSLHNRNK